MIGKIHAARRVRHDQRTDAEQLQKPHRLRQLLEIVAPRSCESVPRGTRASFRPARRTSAFRRGRGPWKRGNSGPHDSRSRRYSEVFPQTAQAMSRGSPRSAAQRHSCPDIVRACFIKFIRFIHCTVRLFFFLLSYRAEVRSVNQNRSGGAIGRGGCCRMRLTLCAACDIIVSIQFIQLGRKTSVIAINYRDPRPIYEQIQAELRRLMLTGALPPGSRLPSVRELAGQLAINPNTIQRAYRELESEGYILSVAGRARSSRRSTGLPSSRKKEALNAFRAAGSRAARARTERRGARVTSDAGGTDR